jgi:threonyl-tRNA synthetase
MPLVMTQHFKVTLPDGSVREVEEGTTPADIAAAIGPGLAKAALAARVNGELRDITRPLEGDAELALVTSRDEADALELVRHDFAHVLAEAVQNLFPGTQITFGPATEDGFYYDFAPAPERGPFTEEDLPAIEEEMRRVIARDEPLVREVWTRDRVRQYFLDQGEAFKAEWVMELPRRRDHHHVPLGGWLDLCRGPHLRSTGKLDPAGLQADARSGAYWRGDQKNAMLSRIYGTGWLNKKQLAEHLTRLEEAAKRDHRRIGQDMDLFHLQSEAQGSVFWHPDGWTIWRQLEAYMRRKPRCRRLSGGQDSAAHGCPDVGAVRPLGQVSRKYVRRPDEVPNVEDEGRRSCSDEGRVDGAEADELARRTSSSSAGHQNLSRPPPSASPRWGCHRNEPHGRCTAILRVRQITQDDATTSAEGPDRRGVRLLPRICSTRCIATFASPICDQARAPPGEALRLRGNVGMVGQSLRDAGQGPPARHPEHGWESLRAKAPSICAKLEFHLTDAIGRTWQVGTIQTDTVLPSGSTPLMSRRTGRSTDPSCSTARSSARSSASSAY